MGAVRKFCDRAAIMSEGRVTNVGNPEEIALEYDKLNAQDNKLAASTEESHPVVASLKHTDGSSSSVFQYKESINIQITWPDNYTVGIAGVIVYRDKEIVFATNTMHIDKPLESGCVLNLQPILGDGKYRVVVGLFGDNRYKPIGFFDNNTYFTISGQPLTGNNREEWQGYLYIKNKWTN